MASQKIRALVNRFYGGPPTKDDMPKVSKEAIAKAKKRIEAKWREDRACATGDDGMSCYYLPPADPKAAKKRSAREAVTWKAIETGLASSDPVKRRAAAERQSKLDKIEQFRHMPFDVEFQLLTHMSVYTATLDAFRDFLGEGDFDIKEVMAFATAWRANQASLGGLDFATDIQAIVDGLLTMHERVQFIYSEGVDFKTQDLHPDADLSKQTGLVANADSRTGMGNSGTAAAIERAQKHQDSNYRPLKTLWHRKHANAVGNVPVGSSTGIEVPSANGSAETTVICSVPGPNKKKNSSFRVKLPTLQHLFHPDKVTRRQMEALRQANNAPYLNADYLNALADERGAPRITQISTIPVSSLKFGFPAPECAKVSVQQLMRYAARHPRVKVKLFTANTPELNAELKKQFDKMGRAGGADRDIPMTKYDGVARDGVLAPPDAAGALGAGLVDGASIQLPRLSDSDDESSDAGVAEALSLAPPSIRFQYTQMVDFVSAFVPGADDPPSLKDLDRALRRWSRADDKRGYARQQVVAMAGSAFGVHCASALGLQWTRTLSKQGAALYTVGKPGQVHSEQISPFVVVRARLAALDKENHSTSRSLPELYEAVSQPYLQGWAPALLSLE